MLFALCAPKVEVIVKVTKEVEGGTLKCHKYWPEPTEDAPSKMVLLGQVEVEFVSTESTDVFITRKFVLRKGSKELKVTMFSYEAWPGKQLRVANNRRRSRVIMQQGVPSRPTVGAGAICVQRLTFSTDDTYVRIPPSLANLSRSRGPGDHSRVFGLPQGSQDDL